MMRQFKKSKENIISTLYNVQENLKKEENIDIQAYVNVKITTNNETDEYICFIEKDSLKTICTTSLRRTTSLKDIVVIGEMTENETINKKKVTYQTGYVYAMKDGKPYQFHPDWKNDYVIIPVFSQRGNTLADAEYIYTTTSDFGYDMITDTFSEATVYVGDAECVLDAIDWSEFNQDKSSTGGGYGFKRWRLVDWENDPKYIKKCKKENLL